MMRRFGFGRLAPALAAALLLVALLAIPAAAHAQLDKPTPADKATVTQPVTVVSGTFVERVNPNGSSLVVKLVGGGTVATGGADPSNAKQMLATPATPLGTGSYLVQWTTVSLDDGELARGTWTFTVAVAPSAAATPPRARHRPRARPPRRRPPRRSPIGRRPVERSDASAIGRRRHDGEWQRRRGPDHRGAHRARRRCRLSPQSTQPPPTTPTPPTTPAPRPRPRRRPRRDPAARGTPGERPRGGDRPCPGPARDGRGHALNPTYESRLPLAVYVVGVAGDVGSVGRLRRLRREAAPAPSTMSATMIGTTTSLPLPVVSSAADGSGVGAIDGATAGGAPRGSRRGGGRARAGVGLAVGVAAADGATATVNVQVPRASSPSSSDTVVHSTRYEPVPSGVAGVAIICWRCWIGPTRGDGAPPTSLTTEAAAVGVHAFDEVPDTTVTGWVTVDLSAGVGLSS